MEEFANNLRNERAKFALSVEQVAIATNIRANIISALEENNIDLLPKPYVNSFVKTLNEFYQKVGVDSGYLEQMRGLTVSSKSSNREISRRNSTVENQKSEVKRREDVLQNYFVEQPKINSFFVEKSENSKQIQETNFSDFEIKKITTKNPQTVENSTVTEISNFINNERNEENFTNISKKKIKQKKTSSQKRFFKNSLNILGRDLLIYSILVMFLVGVIFFIFFYKGNAPNQFVAEANFAANSGTSENLEETNITDVKNNELFSYFDKIDSIVLRAKCLDSAWIKVEIDSKKTEEFFMMPGMESRWSAYEKIILHTSNVGGISFYKNDSLLPKLGASGSMVKNIVITREGIANATPLTTSNLAVPVSELKPTQTKIIPSKMDSSKLQPKKKNVVRRKKTTNMTTFQMMNFSTPPQTKPTILDTSATK